MWSNVPIHIHFHVMCLLCSFRADMHSYVQTQMDLSPNDAWLQVHSFLHDKLDSIMVSCVPIAYGFQCCNTAHPVHRNEVFHPIATRPHYVHDQCPLQVSLSRDSFELILLHHACDVLNMQHCNLHCVFRKWLRNRITQSLVSIQWISCWVNHPITS